MLDKSRPYGQIYPSDEGRTYEQDGKYFTATGEEWTPSPRRGRKRAEETAPDDQVEKQLED